MLKTYDNWRGSLNEYLQVGDRVDDKIVNHFINCLPPKTLNSHLIQMGESYSISKHNRSTYLTLVKTEGQWTYAGTCHVGESEHMESIY